MAKKNAPAEDLVLRESRPTDLEALPENVRQALAQYQTRELVGVAPKWEYEKVGDTVVGIVIKAGAYTAPPRPNEATVESYFLTIESPDGAKTVWLTADLKLRFGIHSLVEAERHVGRCYAVWYKGELLKKDNPKLRNDMHLFGVVEVLPKSADVPPDMRAIGA